jgi:cyanophycinase-like exopeptidase
MKKAILILCLFCAKPIFAQNYTSYFTGNNKDTITVAKGGICLMGGATENDEAMKWFLNRANGGDILVLRATGSNGYNTYLYQQLGIKVNSVESIVCANPNAAKEKYLLDKISKAEGIWFAGGDQWKYVSYFRNTAVDSLINFGIKNKKIVIGGTSAGMAIMGSHYFSAQNGSTTSGTALANPYQNTVTVDGKPFLKNEWLKDIITDTHYDNPDRKGRHLTFLARIIKDGITSAKGIACDEYTSVCIEPDGLAKVYGNFPANDDNAYFIQTNCEVKNNEPEKCESGSPLTWKQAQNAVKVYTVKGTNDGKNTFDLKDWKTGTGGVWQNWFAENGVAKFQDDKAPTCNVTPTEDLGAKNTDLKIFPNPLTQNMLTIQSENTDIQSVSLFDNVGKLLLKTTTNTPTNSISLDMNIYPTGIFFVKVKIENQESKVKSFVKM